MKTSYDKNNDVMYVTYFDSPMTIAFDTNDPDIIYHYDPEKRKVVGLTIYCFSEKLEIDYDILYKDANKPDLIKGFDDISIKLKISRN